LFQDIYERTGWRSKRLFCRIIVHLAKLVPLIVFWPVWTHLKKFLSEGRYLTSHGQDRVKLRKKFNKNNIIASRAQISEVCSESTFQPILQLYLLLPNLMCFSLSSLKQMQVDQIFHELPKLQFMAITTSCLSLSWSFSTYQANMQNGALDFDTNPTGRLVVLLSCMCQIASRLFIFVLFAYSCGPGHFWPLTLAIVLHMFLMAYVNWKVLSSTEVPTNKKLMWEWGQKFHQCVLNGIGNLYMYNNIQALDSGKGKIGRGAENNFRKKLLIVDSVIVVENIVVVILAVFLVEDIPLWLVFGVVGVHTFGLLLKALYYKVFYIWSELTSLPNWTDCPCHC
jgi:hypothetical protein